MTYPILKDRIVFCHQTGINNLVSILDNDKLIRRYGSNEDLLKVIDKRYISNFFTILDLKLPQKFLDKGDSVLFFSSELLTEFGHNSTANPVWNHGFPTKKFPSCSYNQNLSLEANLRKIWFVVIGLSIMKNYEIPSYIGNELVIRTDVDVRKYLLGIYVPVEIRGKMKNKYKDINFIDEKTFPFFFDRDKYYIREEGYIS